MSNPDDASKVWLPVIGRALAHLCVHATFPSNATIADKALLLQSLGLDKGDIAEMLGTTSASVAELMRLAKIRKKGGGGKNGKTKRKR